MAVMRSRKGQLSKRSFFLRLSWGRSKPSANSVFTGAAPRRRRLTRCSPDCWRRKPAWPLDHAAGPRSSDRAPREPPPESPPRRARRNRAKAGGDPCRRDGELEGRHRYIALANPTTDGLAGIPGLTKRCALPRDIRNDALLLPP